MRVCLLACFLLTACSPAAMARPSPPPPICTATDGDTIRCGRERIRLLAIDAPELPGHCRPGRICAPGDPRAARASLSATLASGPIRVTPIARDRYGRTLAMVSAAGRNLSCSQLARRHAIYRADWDNGSRVANTCPSIVRTAPRR